MTSNHCSHHNHIVAAVVIIGVGVIVLGNYIIGGVGDYFRSRMFLESFN